jgi:micrococcal nuclease
MRRPPVLLALLLILSACTQASESVTNTPVPTATASPNATGTASAAPGSPLETTLPTGLTEAKVTRVVDGDTIHVDIAGQDFTVRYIGIDTPETVDPNRPVGCYGPEASVRNKELVHGQTVSLESDVEDKDDFGRLLRYVWLGDEMVNAVLVRDGYAKAETGFAEVKYQDVLLALQGEAQAEGRGLWGPACANTTPGPTITQTPPPASGNEICDYSGATQPVIKGNISSSGEKIYHVPGQSSYDATQIDEASGERWFCTEQEALDAGWRKSKS